MKKTILFLALALCCHSIYSQKKKSSQPISSSVLAKFENLSVEIIKNNLCLLILNKEAKKDTIVLKKNIENSLPKECKILPFSAKNVKLYSISWIENKVTETKLKTEDATTVFTEICELASKTKLLSNAQITTKIK